MNLVTSGWEEGSKYQSGNRMLTSKEITDLAVAAFDRAGLGSKRRED
jgi:hypothetical protein